MMKVEEQAFFKAHITELPATVLKHLKWDILTDRRMR
jgi:hypothetical protein